MMKHKLTTILAVGVCLISLSACDDADKKAKESAKLASLMPTSIAASKFGSGSEFTGKFTKVYGAKFHIEDKKLVHGKIMILDRGNDDYALGFYALKGQEFVSISEPVLVEDVKEPFASELVSKDVPCIVAAKKKGGKATYYYVLNGTLQSETF